MQRPAALQGRFFPSLSSRSSPHWILLLLAMAMPLSSCSKTARARRHLSRSKTAYAQAKSFLLSGEVDQAKPFAERSAAHAEAAMELLPSETFRDAAVKQLDKAGLLSSSFDDPKSTFQLWIQAIREEDAALASFLYDCPRALAEVLSERRESYSKEEWSRLEETVMGSYERTIERYREALLSLRTEQLETALSPEGAVVTCDFQFLDDRVHFGCWLHRDEGMWRIYDFSLGESRSTEVFRTLVANVGEGVDLAAFFEGKGIFEAFSDVEDARKFGLLFHKKPLIGQYVRLRVPVDLRRSGQKERVEKERILKVFDQGKKESGEDVLRVRTTEPNPSESAMGEIPLKAVEVLGNDEDLLWGVSS